MTFEEAREVLLKMAFAESTDFAEDRLFAFGYSDEHEALIIAIEALEKQIPKKPNKGREYGFEWDECPNCECEIDEWNEGEMCGNLFCPHCGQAIKWRDEE